MRSLLTRVPRAALALLAVLLLWASMRLRGASEALPIDSSSRYASAEAPSRAPSSTAAAPPAVARSTARPRSSTSAVTQPRAQSASIQSNEVDLRRQMPSAAIEQEDSEERAPDSSGKRLAIASARWTNEPADPQRTTDTWQQLSAAVTEHRIGVSIADVSCRRTICRYELDFSSPAEVSRLGELRRPGYEVAVESMQGGSSALNAVVYVSPPEYPLGNQ